MDEAKKSNVTQVKEQDFEIVFLPKNLNISELVHKDLPFVQRNANRLPVVKEEIAVILGQLFYQWFFVKKNELEGGFYPLYSRILQELVRGYEPILKWAMENNIIESNGSYKPQMVSTGFRFNAVFWDMPRKEYIYHQALINSLRKHRYDKDATKKFPFLYKCVQEIELDVNHAHEICTELNHQEYHRIDKLQRSDSYKEKRWKKNQINFLVNLGKIDSLQNQIRTNTVKFSQDSTVGRLHTGVTMLKSEVRKECLSWQGEKLATADISNAQPFLSLCLLDSKTYQTSPLDIPGLVNRFNPSVFNSFSSFMLGKNRAFLLKVFDKYIDLVCSGEPGKEILLDDHAHTTG